MNWVGNRSISIQLLYGNLESAIFEVYNDLFLKIECGCDVFKLLCSEFHLRGFEPNPKLCYILHVNSLVLVLSFE